MREQLAGIGYFLLPCGSWELSSQILRLGDRHLSPLFYLTNKHPLNLFGGRYFYAVFLLILSSGWHLKFFRF